MCFETMQVSSYLCRRCRAVHVCLIIQLLELLQRGTWLLSQANNNCLSVVVPDGQSRRRALLWWLEQIVHAIAIDFEILQRDFNLRGPSGILLDLFAPSVYGAQ